MKPRSCAAILVVFPLLVSVVHAQEQEFRADDPRAAMLLGDPEALGGSIAGTWAPRREECFGPRMTTVSPRSIAGPGMACSFDRVSRNGGIVTFSGTCDRGQGAMQESVEAILVSDRLSFAFSRGNGNLVDSLSRCLRPQ